MEEKLKLGKLKAEIRRTENEKPAISAFCFLLSAFCFLLSAFCFHPFYPDSPYAVFLQNTLILWDVVPRAMPWAGMRGPFRAANRRSRISARQGS